VPKDLLLKTCQKLRVLNALRAPDIGWPLTLAQLEALTLPTLISRLVNARRHLLALRISQVLGLPLHKVRYCLVPSRGCMRDGGHLRVEVMDA
jgi:hypothetical protein